MRRAWQRKTWQGLTKVWLVHCHQCYFLKRLTRQISSAYYLLQKQLWHPAPDVGCLGVCITLGKIVRATLQAPAYSAQDLWDKCSREYGVSSQKQDGAALRHGVTLSGLLKHHNRPHVHGYWHGFEAILNTLNVFNITKQACPFPQIPPLWSPKDYYPAQTPLQHYNFIPLSCSSVSQELTHSHTALEKKTDWQSRVFC